MISVKLKKSNIILAEISCLAFLYIIKNVYYFRCNDILTARIDMLENVLYVLVILTQFSRKYLIKQIVIILCCISMLLLCYQNTGQSELLKGLIVILSINNISDTTFFKTIGKIYVVGICLAFLMWFCGMSDPGILRRNGLSLGFATTNIASRIIQLGLFLILVSFLKMKSKCIIFLTCLSIASLTYLTTKSRVSALIILVYPFILCVVEKAIYSRFENIWRNIVVFIPASLMIFAVLLTYFYSRSDLVQLLNQALSNRIFMDLVAIQKYGYTAFGNAANISLFTGEFDPVSNKYINFLTIDSQYIYLLIYYGLLGCFFVIFSMMLCLIKAWNNKNSRIVTITFLLSIYMLTETVGSIFGFVFLCYLTLDTDKRINNAYNI